MSIKAHFAPSSLIKGYAALDILPKNKAILTFGGFDIPDTLLYHLKKKHNIAINPLSVREIRKAMQIGCEVSWDIKHYNYSTKRKIKKAINKLF